MSTPIAVKETPSTGIQRSSIRRVRCPRGVLPEGLVTGLPELVIELSSPSVGDTLLIPIKITNRRQTTAPAGRLFLQQDHNWCAFSMDTPEIPPCQSVVLPKPIEAKPQRDFDVPEFLSIRVFQGKTNQNILLARGTFSLPCSVFTNSVRAMAAAMIKGGMSTAPADRHNILVFGLPGAGKTSLIMSFLTVLSESRKTPLRANVATGASTAKHVTTHLHGYDLWDHFRVPVRLWDTWGVSTRPYRELESFMNGNFPSGTTQTVENYFDGETSESEGNSLPEEKKSKDKFLSEANKPKEKHCMHAVMIVVSTGFLTSETDKKDLKECLKRIKRFTPLVLLSHIDVKFPDIRVNPNNSHKAVQKIIAEASVALGISAMNIFPCVPYVNETQRSFELDRLTFKIFQKCLENAQSFLLQAASTGRIKSKVVKRRTYPRYSLDLVTRPDLREAPPLTQCWDDDPGKRPTMRAICERLVDIQNELTVSTAPKDVGASAPANKTSSVTDVESKPRQSPTGPLQRPVTHPLSTADSSGDRVSLSSDDYELARIPSAATPSAHTHSEILQVQCSKHGSPQSDQKALGAESKELNCTGKGNDSLGTSGTADNAATNSLFSPLHETFDMILHGKEEEISIYRELGGQFQEWFSSHGHKEGYKKIATEYLGDSLAAPVPHPARVEAFLQLGGDPNMPNHKKGGKTACQLVPRKSLVQLLQKYGGDATILNRHLIDTSLRLSIPWPAQRIVL